MNRKVAESQIVKAKLYYKNPELTITQIANLTSVSEAKLVQVYRESFVNGSLNPRNKATALKPRTPNGQGKGKYVPTGIGYGGRNKERKRFSDEQEHQIALDYYKGGLTFADIHEKYGIHPVQMQYIRKQYGAIYGKKVVKHRKSRKKCENMD